MNKLLRRVLQLPVAFIMASYYVLQAVVRPVIKPLARWLAGLRMFEAMRGAIEKLAPYPSLILLIVPVIIVEPLKVVALAIMDTGRILFGAVVLAGSEAMSLLVVERLFSVVKPKLLTLPWFAVAWDWFASLRDQLLEWFHSTSAWSSILQVKEWARSAVRRIASG